MKNAIKTVTFALLLLIPTVGFAQTAGQDQDPDHQSVAPLSQPTPEERVEFLLSAIHGLPPKEAFDRIPDARRIIEKIAFNYDALFQRAAIAALSYYPDAGTLQTWKSLLENKKSSTGLKMQLLSYIGGSFKDDSEALAILKSYLNNKDPDLRIGAIYGLANVQSDASFQLMKERFKVEKDPYVIEKLTKYGRMVR